MKPKSIYLLIAFFVICISSFLSLMLPVSENQDILKISVSDLAFQASKKHILPDINSIKLITWNIQDLGQTKNTEEIAFIVDVLKDFDIVAIQEVVAKDPAGAQAAAKIADELNRMGSKWDYIISNPTKSPSAYISERYAFLWKTSKIDIKGRAYLDNEFASFINREPYIAKFKLKNSDNTFHVINFHSRKYDDKPELEIQFFNNYRRRLNTDKLLIVGDFNLTEKHKVWNELYQQGFEAAVKNSKTTLKRKCLNGIYLSHNIDNIYYSNKIKYIKSGVVDYVETCENLQVARNISDHLPVFFKFAIKNN